MNRPANADQLEYWNSIGGPKWVRYQEMLDRQLDLVGEAVMQAAGVAAGERVLDVGCGCGSTTLALARAVGASGRALGIDISRPMLELAAERARREGLANATFREADAQVAAFEPEFDLLFSRFGVMFFDDPVAAFTNLRGALAASGRLAFVCWQPLRRNAWMAVPLMAAARHLPLDATADPNAPGPFAFADPDRVRGILEGAGFGDVALRALDVELAVGGGGDVRSTVDFVMEVGPLGRALAGSDASVREAVSSAVAEALASYDRDGSVRMPGAVWIVTAKR